MGAAGTDNFCLRWNDFAENVSGAFKDLRAESDFFDVTLACSDSGAQTIQAHKVILSACSNFFKATFRQQMSANKHPNPYIYLRGVGYSDLSAILDFIYSGEVNVAQEDLNSFLAVAEELQIKGLTNRDSASNAGDQAAPKKAKVRPPPPLETPPLVAKKAKKSATNPSKPTTSSPAAAASMMTSIPPNVPQVMTTIVDDKIIDIKDEDVIVQPDPETVGFNNPNDFGGAAPDDYEEPFEKYYGDEDGVGDVPEGMEGGGAAEEDAEGGDITKGGTSSFGPLTSDSAKRFVREIVDAQGQKVYQCTLCKMQTKHNFSMQRHMIKHTRPSSHLCQYCQATFPNKFYLIKQISDRICMKNVMFDP